MSDKSKIFLSIPELNPDKILGEPITGVFTTDTTPATGAGALYNGTVTLPNPAGKKAFPISRYTENGQDYYFDSDQVPDGVIQNATVITAVTESQIKYRWATFTSPHTITYETVLISIED